MNSFVQGVVHFEIYQDNLVAHRSNNSVLDEYIALVNPPKGTFSSNSLQFLENPIDSSSFKPDPVRLFLSQSLNRPISFSELHSLVGSLQYCSLIIPNFSCTMESIINMLPFHVFFIRLPNTNSGRVLF